MCFTHCRLTLLCSGSALYGARRTNTKRQISATKRAIRDPNNGQRKTNPRTGHGWSGRGWSSWMAFRMLIMASGMLSGSTRPAHTGTVSRECDEDPKYDVFALTMDPINKRRAKESGGFKGLPDRADNTVIWRLYASRHVAHGNTCFTKNRCSRLWIYWCT